MAAETSKLEKIIKEINRAADSVVAKTKKEAGAFQRSEMKKAQEQAKQEIAAAQFTALDRLNEQMNADLALSEKEETETLLRRRNEITAEVFAEARRRIAAFADGAEYAGFLTASAARIRDLLGGDSVFYLRPADETYFALLRDFCGEIRPDGEITLGGIRAESAAKGLIADDTLDSRLAQSAQDFYENSGLTVTI